MPKLFTYLLLMPVTALGAVSEKPKSLGLAEAVTQAMSNNPELLQEREKEAQAQQTLYKAYGTLAPDLNLDLGLSQAKDALTGQAPRFNGEWFNSYTARVEARSTLYGGGAILGTLASLKKSRDAARIQRQQKERQLRRQVLQNFYQLLLSERQLTNIRNRQLIQQELLKTAESRYRIGNEQALSVMQIKTGLLLLVPQVAAAENSIQLAANELGNVLGMTASEVLSISGSLRPPTSVGVLPGARTPLQRLELELTRLELARIEDQRAVSMAVHFPKLDAFARWGRNTFRRSDLLDSDATQTELGLELKVPLFSGLTSVFDRRILSHNEAILRIEERRLRDSFELERVRAEKNFRFALTQAQTYQLALRQAEESVRVANRTYRLGTSTYLQVSDAQKNLAEAEINFETAQFEVLQKVSDLYVAFGWPLEEWVDQLDRHYLSLQKP